MKNQVIEFVELRSIRVPFESKDCYTLRTDRKAVWLQRILFFILGKLGAWQKLEKEVVERHVINPDTFMERLFKQQETIVRFFDRKPKKLLIGAEDFKELMSGPITSHGFSFQAEYYHSKEICGLQVDVIPWMKGVLVMP